LGLEEHQIFVPKAHFAYDEIQFPHEAKLLVVESGHFVTVRVERLLAVARGFCTVNTGDFDIRADQSSYLIFNKPIIWSAGWFLKVIKPSTQGQ